MLRRLEQTARRVEFNNEACGTRLLRFSEGALDKPARYRGDRLVLNLNPQHMSLGRFGCYVGRAGHMLGGHCEKRRDYH